MKKFLSISMISAALAMGTVGLVGTASADTYNIAIDGVNVAQNVGPMAQNATSAAIAVGNTGVNAAQTSTALNAAAMSTIDETADLTGGSMVTGNGVFDNTNQVVATATQNALSIAGSGAMGNGSTQTAGALNFGAMANTQVKVTYNH